MSFKKKSRSICEPLKKKSLNTLSPWSQHYKLLGDKAIIKNKTKQNTTLWMSIVFNYDSHWRDQISGSETRLNLFLSIENSLTVGSGNDAREGNKDREWLTDITPYRNVGKFPETKQTSPVVQGSWNINFSPTNTWVAVAEASPHCTDCTVCLVGALFTGRF